MIPLNCYGSTSHIPCMRQGYHKLFPHQMKQVCYHSGTGYKGLTWTWLQLSQSASMEGLTSCISTHNWLCECACFYVPYCHNLCGLNAWNTSYEDQTYNRGWFSRSHTWRSRWTPYSDTIFLTAVLENKRQPPCGATVSVWPQGPTPRYMEQHPGTWTNIRVSGPTPG